MTIAGFDVRAIIAVTFAGASTSPTKFKKRLNRPSSTTVGADSVGVADVGGGEANADDVIDRLFLAILSRYPTDAERKLAHEQNDHRELAWALLLSSEFSLNH